MKLRLLTSALLFSAFSASASSIKPPSFQPARDYVFVTKSIGKPECTFTASASINIVGQTASITCTSSQASCDGAISDVARCIKIARNKLRVALGL